MSEDMTWGKQSKATQGNETKRTEKKRERWKRAEKKREGWMEKKQEKPEKEGKEQPAVTCTAAHHNPNHSQTHIYPTQRLITKPAIPHGVSWRDSSDPEIYRHPDSLSSIAINKG